MIAFIPDAPSMVTQANSYASTTIYMGWNARRYVYRKTAAGILVLLTILISLNAIAIYLRKKIRSKMVKGKTKMITNNKVKIDVKNLNLFYGSKSKLYLI